MVQYMLKNTVKLRRETHPEDMFNQAMFAIKHASKSIHTVNMDI